MGLKKDANFSGCDMLSACQLGLASSMFLLVVRYFLSFSFSLLIFDLLFAPTLKRKS